MDINIFIVAFILHSRLSLGFHAQFTYFAASVITTGTDGIMERTSFVDVTVYKSLVSGRDLSCRRSTLPGEYKSAKLEWYSDWASAVPI